MSIAKAILACLFGLVLLCGATAAWKFWHIDGFLAFLIGAAGVTLIGHAFGKSLV